MLSVSSGAAAHRHVNDINSTIYHLKVCRNVPPAAFSLWLFRVTPSNSCPFWYLDPWLYYRFLHLGKCENLIITTSFSLNQELPSIKEVNMENEMTKKTSIYVQSIEEREALLFPFEDIHWLFNSLPQTYHYLSPLPHSSSYPCFSFSLTHSFLLSHTHTHSNTNIHMLCFSL